MKILVTGGCGFIGSHLIDLLLTKPEITEIVNIDCLTYAGQLRPIDDARYRHYTAGIGDRWRLIEIFERHQPDWVFHLAAESHVDNSITHPDLFISTNIVGTANLLSVCQRPAFKVSRFLYVSSDEVFGSIPAPDYATEDSPFRPSSPYSASKASADLLVQAWIKTYGFPGLIVRPCNAYGPRQYPEKLIPKAIKLISEDKPVPIYGDGLQIRDWIYVKDLVEGLWAVMTTGEFGKAYNLVGHYNEKFDELTNLRLIEIIGTLMMVGSKIEHVADRPGHDRRYGMTTRLFDWEATTPLLSGLAETIVSTGYIEQIKKQAEIACASV